MIIEYKIDIWFKTDTIVDTFDDTMRALAPS